MQTVSLFAAYPRRMAAKSSLRAGTAEVGSSHLTRASELAEGARKTIAYAVSVTADGSYVDGAAVLAQSCIRVHRGGASRYGVDLVAFVAPVVSAKGRGDLEALGYRVLVKPLPLEVEEIRGDYLRSHIGSNGCCGAWELLKLYAWTLTEYHRVVHLDMDALVLRSLDALYDDPAYGGDVRAVYTYDWTMATPPWGHNPPVQGGFIVATPDMDTYEALVDVVREGDFRPKTGWGGTGAGAYWGGMTIQGLLPYFFDRLRPTAGAAVSNCVYNNMASNPRSVGGFGKGDCRDGTKPPAVCEDCRLVDAESVMTTHFTICQKPWTCTSAKSLSCPYCPLCAKFHEKWFEIRAEMEAEWGTGGGYTGKAEARFGMCDATGAAAYRPVPIGNLTADRARRWRGSWQQGRGH